MSNHAVFNANGAVDRTTNRAVNGAAGWAVRRVVVDAARTWPNHPALQDFLCFARRT